MEGGASSSSGFPFPRTIEEVFKDFKGRRQALLKALTSDVDEFYAQCDPEKENLCLFGHRNETWQVNMPVEEVPPEIPEPALGINFARDGMQSKDWISLVAVHSDAWLMAVAFYFGARFGFDKNDRKKLFKMINDLPSLFEVVTEIAKRQASEKTTATPHGSNRNKPSGIMQQRQPEPQSKGLLKMPPPQEEQEEEEEDSGGEEGEDDEQGATCGACGDSYASDEFWICCDVCEKWFHGSCVKITPAKAESIKHYKCPACSSNKRLKHG
ncbi:hypothetical protein MKW98_019486 [Papaver atlanticum]|uniref:PHD finger protein ALFIN-LIKE n=1 Tax=Papaver atlanticum TaxID=357466 RepID=A0AAD4XB36_9MAGN|nr:hypothetical protein MKW98_019486 [Papaver atlanticum]